MVFEYGGKKFDTDKYVYVVGHRHNIFKKYRWDAVYRDTLYWGIDDEIQCKRCYIRNIEMDFNNGKSFVKSFEAYCPGYHFNSTHYFIAPTAREAKAMYTNRNK